VSDRETVTSVPASAEARATSTRAARSVRGNASILMDIVIGDWVAEEFG
jgi:hypothetical protein